MTENKTQATGVSVADFIAGVEPLQRRADAVVLDALFRRVTGFEPRMWGPTIIGYGRYRYVYDSGHSGEMCATGFSPRKAQQVLYIMPGYADFGPVLARLGKYKMGKSCLYINKLDDVDLAVLEELIRAGLADLAKKWQVLPD
jgi:hypothetical protein